MRNSWLIREIETRLGTSPIDIFSRDSLGVSSRTCGVSRACNFPSDNSPRSQYYRGNYVNAIRIATAFVINKKRERQQFITQRIR